MNTWMDLSREYPRAVGTVEEPTTAKVTGTFEDGTERVIVKRELE